MIKTIFQIFSIIFHPLLLVFYLLCLILFFNPYIFGFPNFFQGDLILIYTFILSFFIPLISVMLFKATGLIDSIKMENKMERIGPLIVSSIFYLWFYINCKNNTSIPAEYTLFVFGALVTLLLSFVVNVIIKLSLHASALTALTTYFLILFFEFNGYVFETMLLFRLIVLSFLVLGIVSVGRLYLRAHDLKEIYIGVLLGFFSQLIAYLIMF